MGLSADTHRFLIPSSLKKIQKESPGVPPLMKTMVSFQFVSHRFISCRAVTEGGLAVSAYMAVIKSYLLPSREHSCLHGDLFFSSLSALQLISLNLTSDRSVLFSTESLHLYIYHESRPEARSDMYRHYITLYYLFIILC